MCTSSVSIPLFIAHVDMKKSIVLVARFAGSLYSLLNCFMLSIIEWYFAVFFCACWSIAETWPKMRENKIAKTNQVKTFLLDVILKLYLLSFHFVTKYRANQIKEERWIIIRDRKARETFSHRDASNIWPGSKCCRSIESAVKVWNQEGGKMESGLYIYPVFKMALKTGFTPLYANKFILPLNYKDR